MRRIALIVLCAVALSGCATSGGTSPSSSDITAKIKQVQQIAATTCKFIPTVATIVSIFSKSAGSSFSVASDICAAISTAPLADGPGKPGAYAHGVRIRGKHI